MRMSQFLFRKIVVVVVLLFYVHGKHLRSCRDGSFVKKNKKNKHNKEYNGLN